MTSFKELVDVVAKLRSPQGCPWDREQTHETLLKHLLEETYEVIEAIESGSDAKIQEELGDLLLQVVMHSQLATEDARFQVGDVIAHVTDKLVRRHPHVFGDVKAETADAVLANWERLKRAEKGSGVMDGVPKAMPALARAAKLTRRAALTGFESSNERASPREIGPALFELASQARKASVDPEAELRKTTDDFERRFRAVETRAKQKGLVLESLSPAEWRQYWSET